MIDRGAARTGAVALSAAVLAAALAGCSARPGAAGTSGSPGPATAAPSSPTPSSPAPAATGPAPTAAPAGTTTPGLRDGPGPQAVYRVQPQPAAGSCHYGWVGNDPRPDPACTPGALNPQVTPATIGATVCRRGYTSSIRPPESVTEPEKEASARAYGYTGPLSTAEYDHLVPLELGGDPNDPANLWVEPNDDPAATSTANTKDTLEDRLNQLVCAGRLALGTAQEAIASDWVAAYRTYVGPLPSFPTPPTAPAAAGASCTASAAPADDGYAGDYEVTVHSNQPDEQATARDAGDSWSAPTDAAGDATIRLYRTSPGMTIDVTVGAASCTTTA